MGLWSRLSQFYPVWLEPVLGLLIFFSFWYPLAQYPEMPARIPIHFGFSGLPDAWTDKNLGALLLGPLIAAISYGGMTFLSCWIALVDDPKKVINASEKRLAAMSEARAEEVRRATLVFLFGIKLVLVAMLAYLSYGETMVALGAWEGLGWPSTALVALLLGLCGFFTWRILVLVYGPEKYACGQRPGGRP
ncbi:MAG: DUF1648 domain-containing protein [Clostridia bacterium]|nr:DUF1648 domain-containing protein [Clostridia bacterium]